MEKAGTRNSQENYLEIVLQRNRNMIRYIEERARRESDSTESGMGNKGT